MNELFEVLEQILGWTVIVLSGIRKFLLGEGRY